MSSMLCCTAATNIRLRKPVLNRDPDLTHTDTQRVRHTQRVRERGTDTESETHRHRE